MAMEAATPQGGPTRLEDRVFDDRPLLSEDMTRADTEIGRKS